MKRMTFLEFLRSREHEDSPIGDLAQDLRIDRRARDWRGRVTPESLRARIVALSGCSEALDAADEAAREWREHEERP